MSKTRTTKKRARVPGMPARPGSDAGAFAVAVAAGRPEHPAPAAEPPTKSWDEIEAEGKNAPVPTGVPASSPKTWGLIVGSAVSRDGRRQLEWVAEYQGKGPGGGYKLHLTPTHLTEPWSAWGGQGKRSVDVATVADLFTILEAAVRMSDVGTGFSATE